MTTREKELRRKLAFTEVQYLVYATASPHKGVNVALVMSRLRKKLESLDKALSRYKRVA